MEKKLKEKQIKNLLKIKIIKNKFILKKTKKTKLFQKKVVFLLFLISIFFMLEKPSSNIITIKEFKTKKIKSNIKDNITIVSAYFRIDKSKHKYDEYFVWISNFLQINCSMIFFIDDSISKEIIPIRPKELQKRTLWIRTKITDFYSYKNYLENFKYTYQIDVEKNLHSVPLYLIWAEKINFLNSVALKNYYNSKCFYWVDSGCFRENKTIKHYVNNWLSPKKCFEDGRIIMNEIEKYSEFEKEQLKNFTIEMHLKMQRQSNSDGSIFGGQKEYIFKFHNIYYDTLKKFIDHGLFIGKEQNLYAYIAYTYTDVINYISYGNYFSLREYLSKDNNS